MQFCWKPDYDPYYYQQLRKRSQNVFLFRGEYVFQMARAIVAEIPQLGHATYIFAKPLDVREFVRTYASTCRDDIRRNRGNAPNTSASWDASCTAVAHVHGYANSGQGSGKPYDTPLL